MFVIFALLFSFSVFSQDCEPVISINAVNGVSIKEGNGNKPTSASIFVEMDRYCTVPVKLTILVRGQSAVIGEHVLANELNTLTIPAGQVGSYFDFSVVGDNEWNEDREFFIQAINPNHGSISISTIDFIIKNDDPQISIEVVSKITEPRKANLPVALKVKLSMPAEQRITGELEIRDQSATNGKDFSASPFHSFEILPGEKEFTFLNNTLLILSDDEKEDKESIRLFLNNIKNATASNQSALLIIEDPKNYKLTFNSEVEIVSDNQVGIISKYQFVTDIKEETKEGDLSTEVFIPTYTHAVSGMPGKIKTFPGKGRIILKLNEEGLQRLRFEFIESPTEVYPYSPQRYYIFMSSFGKLHEDEFITIQNPEFPSAYPAFDFSKMRKINDGKWEGKYIRNLSEEGETVMREQTIILLQEIL